MNIYYYASTFTTIRYERLHQNLFVFAQKDTHFI